MNKGRLNNHYPPVIFQEYRSDRFGWLCHVDGPLIANLLTVTK
jgi:hypothetical protein